MLATTGRAYSIDRRAIDEAGREQRATGLRGFQQIGVLGVGDVVHFCRRMLATMRGADSSDF